MTYSKTNSLLIFLYAENSSYIKSTRVPQKAPSLINIFFDKSYKSTCRWHVSSFSAISQETIFSRGLCNLSATMKKYNIRSVSDKLDLTLFQFFFPFTGDSDINTSSIPLPVPRFLEYCLSVGLFQCSWVPNTGIGFPLLSGS